MALLPILHHPDPRLKKIATEIKRIDKFIQQLAQDMLETMYEAPGVGLAATQVNHLVRMIVVDVSAGKDEPHILINPIITEKHDMQYHDEGCLSVPGIYAEIERAETIIVEALNERDEPIKLTVDGLLSVCIQHEIDHLDGKLFVDYLSNMKQQRILKKMQKLQVY